MERTNSSTKFLLTHTGASRGSPRELRVWTTGARDSRVEGNAPCDFSVATLRGAKTRSWWGGEGARAAAHIPSLPPHKVGLCLGLLAPSPGEQQWRAGGEGRGGEARARGTRAWRSRAWRGSAGVPGAPGAERSQPSQSGARSPKLSHRGERLGRRSGTGLRSLSGRLQPQLRCWPRTAA